MDRQQSWRERNALSEAVRRKLTPTNHPTPRIFMMSTWINKVALALAVSVQLVFIQIAPAQDLFPDKALEAAVRKEVFAKRYNEEALTKDDVKNISQVHAKGKGIKSLEGMQNCVSVQEIDFENNEIVDLKPLADLKLIQSINLAGNKIENVEPLAALSRVQYLELSRNAVTDIYPLSNMSNMRSLYLSENKIEKIDVVKGLPKVWTLYLAGNPVKDFAPIGEMKWLTSLDLRNCAVEDLGFLRNLTELNFLMLVDNKIKDLGPLVEMATADKDRRFAPFWRLYLAGNPLEEKAKGEQVEALKKLGARIELEKTK
jgi:internalin A